MTLNINSLKRSDSSSPFPIYLILGSQNFSYPEKSQQIVALLDCLEVACQHGVSYFQFRDKDHSRLNPEERRNLGREAQKICRHYGIPFLIDDDLSLMEALDADGIHLGQHDLNAEFVRQRLDSQHILGVSAHQPDQVRAAIQAGADYVGSGPIFPTQTKLNVRPSIGLQTWRQLQAVDPNFPIFAIGGIHENNVDQVKAFQADAICVISAISQSKNIGQTLAKLAAPLINQ